MFLSAVLILAALLIILKFTMFGKAINALSDDEEVAKIVGINTNKIISYVFLIDAGIAGWAGILVGYDTGIEPTMGLNLFLKGVIAAIVGGIGSVSGGLWAGLFWVCGKFRHLENFRRMERRNCFWPAYNILIVQTQWHNKKVMFIFNFKIQISNVKSMPNA